MAEAKQMEEGSVILFNNNSDNPNAPAVTGRAMVNGQELEIALWPKQGKTVDFFSGTIKPKGQDRSREAQVFGGGRKPESQDHSSNMASDEDGPF